MRRFLAALILLVVALPAMAQPPYYARGTFGDPANDPVNHTDPWADLTHQMIDQGGGHYTATVGDVNTYFPGVVLKYKLANADYSTQSPTSTDGAVVTDNNGEVNFNLWTNNGNPWTDGWSPSNGPRAGYQDPGQFGWEINGSFNSWSPTADPNYALTNQGNGLYTGTFTMQPGIYQYKFREQGSYDVSVGTDFGNNAGNNLFRVWDPNEQWTFKLDLPNGRFQATSSTPTPDVNNDSLVTAADYVLWRKTNGSAAQYTEIRKHFGELPPNTTYYVRGNFNNFDESIAMTSVGPGQYDGTVTGLTPTTTIYQFKLANDGFIQEAPVAGTNNVKVVANAAGEIHTHLYDQLTWNDGWMPNDQRRAGYDDPGVFGWELMGDWSGFATPNSMSGGTGLYTTVQALTAGRHEFKFRKAGDWAINIGVNFASDYNNAVYTAAAAGNYEFDLDLPHGRWRVIPVAGSGSLAGSAVPEPASLAMLMLGLTLLGSVRRR
jgi:PEP-CTERM motif